MGKKPSKRWRPAVFWASVLGASSLGESAAWAGNAGVRAMRKAKEKEAAVRNRTGNLSACKGSAAISRRFGNPGPGLALCVRKLAAGDRGKNLRCNARHRGHCRGQWRDLR